MPAADAWGGGRSRPVTASGQVFTDAFGEALIMTDQDWLPGYQVVTARDASGRRAVPTRVGLKRTEVGVAVAAECGSQTLVFPLPDAAKFVLAFQQAIRTHTEFTGGELS